MITLSIALDLQSCGSLNRSLSHSDSRSPLCFCVSLSFSLSALFLTLFHRKPYPRIHIPPHNRTPHAIGVELRSKWILCVDDRIRLFKVR